MSEELKNQELTSKDSTVYVDGSAGLGIEGLGTSNPTEKLEVTGFIEDPVGSVAPGEEGELSPKEVYNNAAQTIEAAAKDLEISHTVHTVRNSTYSKDRRGTKNAAYEKLGRVLAECYGLELRESSDKGITTFTFVGK